MRILFILFALTLAACQKSEIVVSKILIDRLEGAEALPVERSELRQWIQTSLSSQGKIVFRLGDKEGGLLRVKIGVILDSTHNQPNRIYLSTQYVRTGEEGIQKLEANTWIPFESSRVLRAEFQSGLKQNLDNIVSELAGQKMGSMAAAQKIRAYVNGKSVSEHEVVAAIQKVGQDKDASVVDALKKVLQGPNLRLAIKSLVALGQIGDTSSVEAVTEFAERKSPEVRRHAIEAVHKIGGRTAAAWLFTLSTGHHDVQVRSAALMALKDVERRLENSRPHLEASAQEFVPRK